MRLWILQDARLYALMQRLDFDLAQTTRASGCPHCGDILHSARYPRKPRGGPSQLDEDHHWRQSFCCAREGCRRRQTPPSVCFLGRRVYFGAVMVLVCALRDGLSGRRVQELRELLGVDRRTLRRWQVWWREVFCRTGFWRTARTGFVPAVDAAALPGSLLDRFVGSDELERLTRVLRFLAPLAGAN